MKRFAAAIAVPTVALLLTACSQVASLTPVGGSSITSVRNAANDVVEVQFLTTRKSHFRGLLG